MADARVSRRGFLGRVGLGAATLAGSSLGCRGTGTLPGSQEAELITRQETPLNAEPALDRLVLAALTPNRYFYQRRHGTVPQLAAESYALRVTGLVERPQVFRLEDLESDFEKRSVTATLQCAGNRRCEHSRRKKVGGVPWDAGAIGTAEWSGIRLADLLRKAGPRAEARHVAFHSLDECVFPGGRSEFAASIPLEKALAPETLLATGMNGERLSREHGYPVRSLVPGVLGARSVKWLGEIRVTGRPSDNFYQARDYKLFPPDVTAETARWDQAEALAGLPTNSAICSPLSGAKVAAGRVKLKGYALAAPGTAITRVEVSADGGRQWREARVGASAGPFTWNLWEADLALEAGERLLTVRAWDSSGAVQPEVAPWNFKGYQYNGWHPVPVSVI